MKKDNPHVNHRSRVRQRFIENGLRGFADHEALELLLYYCYPRVDTNEIAHRMIKEYGSLYNLFEADTLDIMKRCNTTENVAVLVSLIPKMANLYFSRRWNRKTIVMDNADTAGEYVTSLFVGQTVEVFYVLCLDTARKLNYTALIAEGTLDQTPAYPRSIANAALTHQAASIILTHNHPGGTDSPSIRDVEATRHIVRGMGFLGIKVIDHILVAGDKFYSFAKQGRIVEGY